MNPHSSLAELRQRATTLAEQLVATVTPDAVLRQMAGCDDLDTLTAQDWATLVSVLSSYKPAPKNNPATNVNTLRRRAFALAAGLYGPTQAEQTVRDLIGGSLSNVSRERWQEIVEGLLARKTAQEAPGCEPAQWRLIQYKRRQLGMTDKHLDNLIKSVLKIDAVKWLDARGARRILTVLNRQQAARARTAE